MTNPCPEKDTSLGGGWIHSRDYSLWINVRTGRWESYSKSGELLATGVVDDDPLQRAFGATPEQLGRAAVEQADLNQ